MNKSFLIVFHGRVDNDKIIDIGEDPCFEDPPSWGICRPPTRKAVKAGDTLIFIAKVNSEYFLKGWFEVGFKLDYIAALNTFPKRKNVIISTHPSLHKIEWRDKKMQKNYQDLYGNAETEFLNTLISAEDIFYQNSDDKHELDNWKCRRVFHCNYKQVGKCIMENNCLKNGFSLTSGAYSNYIVADKDKWADLDSLRITFDEIAEATGFMTPIKTPKGQHNVLRFDSYKEKLFELINKKQVFTTTKSLMQQPCDKQS